MNKHLDNQTYTCPPEIVSQLQKGIDGYSRGGNTEGLRRAIGIVRNPEISYQQMNRIQNWFSEHDNGDNGYELIGGDKMKEWVLNTMKNSTNSVELGKRVKRITDFPGNSEQEEGGTKDVNKNPTGVNIPKISKGSQATYVSGEETTYEQEIKSIQTLIEYMDNKKQIL